jgi:hypothetical protein
LTIFVGVKHISVSDQLQFYYFANFHFWFNPFEHSLVKRSCISNLIWYEPLLSTQLVLNKGYFYCVLCFSMFETTNLFVNFQEKRRDKFKGAKQSAKIITAYYSNVWRTQLKWDKELVKEWGVSTAQWYPICKYWNQCTRSIFLLQLLLDLFYLLVSFRICFC